MSQPSARQRRKLKNLLINARYQIRFMLWAAVSCVVLISYFAIILYTMLREYHSNVVAALGPELQSQINADYAEIVFRLVGGSALIFMVALCVGLLLSHKTAGPLHQLQRTFDRVRGGDYTARVKFRPGDDFAELGDTFNSMMDEIQRRS